MTLSTGRIITTGIVAAVLLVAVVPLWAQESRDGERILHRYFDISEWDEGQQSAAGDGPPSVGDQRQAQHPPAAPGDAPGLWASPLDGEWILTPDGPEGPADVDSPHGDLDDGGGETPLDASTDRVDALDYQANFQPSVVPFKRGVVQDQIRSDGAGDYSAYLGSRRSRPVSVGGSLGAGEERFWGSFLVRMEPGMRHRIPSVSPHQRVLSVDTEPRIELQIERDAADNFYVSGPEQDLVRINIELAVDRQYFDGALDDSISWEAFDQSNVDLGDQLRAKTEEVLQLIGISPSAMSPRQALERLVEYHRSFEARPFPETLRGDRYVEISEQQIGVCRHRSLTFMITAGALGISSRYVYNEAHAFVEVYWPGQGWRRIDLGGAADAFNYSSSDDSEVHDGIWDDEFPRPDIYEEEMAHLAGDGSEGSGEGEGQYEADEGEQPGDSGDGHTDEMPPGDHEHGDLGDMQDMLGDTLPTDEDPGDAPEMPKVVELLEADGEVLRGERVRVRGRVDDVEAGAEVEVMLFPSGSRESGQGVSLGRAVVDQEGYFGARWEVPRQATLGRWRLVGRVVE